MKPNRVRSLLWMAAALVAGWSLYRFVDFVRGKDRYLTPLGEREVREPLMEKGSAARARVARNWDDHRHLYGLDVMGKPPPTPTTGEIGPPVPPPPEDSPVSDLLRVLYVMFDGADPEGTLGFNLEDFTGHFCYVQYKDPTLEKIAEPLLCVGDRLPEPHGRVQVMAIHEDRVVFRRVGEGDEEVPVLTYEMSKELVLGVLERGEAPAIPPAKGVPRDWPAATTEVQPHRWKVCAADVEEVTSRANEILGTGEITVVPHYRRGESSPSGILIGSIRSGSILEGKGLRAGDVLRSIDGTPVRSREQVIEYIQSHPDLRSFTLGIERLGSPRTLHYSLPR